MAAAVLPPTEGCSCASACRLSPIAIAAAAAYPPLPAAATPSSVASAFVGAGVVALGAASNLPDAKAVNPTVLQGLENASVTGDALADARRRRAARQPRRGPRRQGHHQDQRRAGRGPGLAAPPRRLQFTSPYGVRWGKLHAGIDLAAPEGTPYKAVHAGEVTAGGLQRRLRLRDHGQAGRRHRDHLRALPAPAGQDGRQGQGRPGDRRGRQHRATRTAPTCTSRST